MVCYMFVGWLAVGAVTGAGVPVDGDMLRCGGFRYERALDGCLLSLALLSAYPVPTAFLYALTINCNNNILSRRQDSISIRGQPVGHGDDG